MSSFGAPFAIHKVRETAKIWKQHSIFTFNFSGTPDLGTAYDHTKGRITCFKTMTNRLIIRMNDPL